MWIVAPNGTPTFGTVPRIDNRFDPELCCPAGEIRLPVGNIAKGYIHLNQAARLARIAPATPEAYVYAITSAYDEIWVQRGRGSLLLVRRQGGVRSATLSLSLVQEHYCVITAFPLMRSHNFRRRREVRIWP